MKRLSTLLLALAVSACGSESIAPPVATTIVLSKTAVSLDAFGATAQVTATVKDQRGEAMTSAPVTWSAVGGTVSATPVPVSATSTTVAVPTVNLVALANGNGTLTATSGGATVSIPAVVKQVPSTANAISATALTARIGTSLAALPSIRVADALGSPIEGVPVTFALTNGSGTLTGATVPTNTGGIATLGGFQVASTASVSTITATVGSLAPIAFTITAATTIISSVTLTGGDQQAGLAGAAVTDRPTIVVRDPQNQPVAGVAVAFTVSSGGGSVTSPTTVTDATGTASAGTWTLGSTAAPNTVTATLPGSGYTGSPIVFNAYGCTPGAATGFSINVCFTSDMTATQRSAFLDAAARWGTVVTGDLSNVSFSTPFTNSCGSGTPTLSQTIDDVWIFAAIVPIDGVGQVLGSAGPCLVRTGGGLPLLGSMRFDVADMAGLETTNRLTTVILHEMGHVLGIGTLWSRTSFLANTVTTGGPVLDTYFNGTQSLAAFDLIGGNLYSGGLKVPVENTGGSGTANGHWRETVLKNELMTGFVQQGANPMSALTIASLADLGYSVNMSLAEAFSPGFSVMASEAFGTPTPALSLMNDISSIPTFTVDASGKKGTRVR